MKCINCESIDRANWKKFQNKINDNFITFDVAKHVVLCFEFKHLYVVITRARVRFLMIEFSNDVVWSFMRLMIYKSNSTIIKVIFVDDNNFDEKIKILQSRKFDDSHHWRVNEQDMMSREFYKDACFYFRKVEDFLKEKKTKTYIDESREKEFDVVKKIVESHVAFQSTISTFRELSRVKKIIKLLIRLNREHVDLFKTCNSTFTQEWKRLIYHKTLQSFDVHMKNSRKSHCYLKRFLNLRQLRRRHTSLANSSMSSIACARTNFTIKWYLL